MSSNNNSVSRRDVVKSAAIIGTAAMASAIPQYVHAASSDTIKVGLVGCGGRGGGAAGNALAADPNVKIVALGDMFPEKAELLATGLVKKHGERVQLPKERLFSGWDAIKGVIAESDVVLLATPPHFRPQHLKMVIEAGKHCFCEKPVATDAPGLRSVIESVELAKKKNVNLVSGLCYRYAKPQVETVNRIHDGMLGDIVALHCQYLTTGLWSNKRDPKWSEMEFQLRNWLYFTWLSGDHIVEQHIHSLDKILWTMKDEAPESVTATGGRTVRTTGEEFGNVYDHFNTVYEWKNGVKCFAGCRQFPAAGVANETSDWVYGTKGKSSLMDAKITTHTGENIWRMDPKEKNASVGMYDAEHMALYTAIRNNQTLNNGDYMVKATGMAIMGRMSAYTGQKITYKQMLKSEENLAPEKYAFGDIPVPTVAVPGKTKFF